MQSGSSIPSLWGAPCRSVSRFRAEMIFPSLMTSSLLRLPAVEWGSRLISAGWCEAASDVAVRQRCVKGLWGGAAVLSGSAGQSLPQLSDFLQQLSLAAVQMGSASIQRNWKSKIMFTQPPRMSANITLVYFKWTKEYLYDCCRFMVTTSRGETHGWWTCSLKVNCCSDTPCGFPSLLRKWWHWVWRPDWRRRFHL